jgi:excisionase family DNA binding protein
MARKAKNPDYLTAKEVADRCRVTRRTVYNWIKDGVLGADRAGPKVWLVSEAHLAAFLKRGRVLPTAASDGGTGEASKQQRPAQRPARPPQPQPVAVPLGFDLGDVDEDLANEVRADYRVDDYRHEVGDQETLPAPRPSLPAARLSVGKKKKPGGRKR